MPLFNPNLTLEVLNKMSAKTMVEYLGITFTRFGDDFIEARMPVDHRTHQPLGLLHGGASVTLAETLGSMAAACCIDMNKQYCVGLDINANHVKSVREGFVTGITKPIHVGKKTHVWEIRITNEQQELVCISRITMANTPLQEESELFHILLNHAYENEYSFALWQLPNSQEKNLILSFTSTPPLNTILEELPEGFIFSPFDIQKQKYFLKADLKFSFTNKTLCEPRTPLEISSQNWLGEVVSKANLKKAKPHYPNKKFTGASADKNQFEQLVQASVQQIEAGTFEKIVPSRSKSIELPKSFDAIEAFQKLCKSYPGAMVSFISIPSVGTWLGATPELLVSVEGQSTFRTVALAGTKIFKEGINLKDVAWTQKEIEEQALVSRYIINNFKKIRLREFDEHGPKTMVAGNLMHLKTEFSVDMIATNFPQLGSVMLNLLHPTSAVCGMPLEPSLKFLEQNENYDREFYSGYLGPVKTNNNIHIYVNLRCMQLFEQHAIVYAGAGVTVDSVPEHEWEETEMKLNTLLNVIL
jgi:isochorismate synthase